MKLYDVPREAKLLLSLKTPDDEQPHMMMCTFNTLDGMYSNITVDEDGSTIHLAAITPMKKVGNHYEIDEPEEGEIVS